VFIISKCNAKRGHFEVNASGRRWRRCGQRGADGFRQRLWSCQTLCVHAIDV